MSVFIRRLWVSDKQIILNHLLNLDPESRRNRFMGNISDEFLMGYVDRLFLKGDLIFGAFLYADFFNGPLAGILELRDTDVKYHKEIALSVDKNYRRQQIGTMLFQRALCAAANHGVERVEMSLLPDNDAVKNLVKKFNAHLTFDSGDIVGWIGIEVPNKFVLYKEFVKEASEVSMAFIRGFLK